MVLKGINEEISIEEERKCIEFIEREIQRGGIKPNFIRVK